MDTDSGVAAADRKVAVHNRSRPLLETHRLEGIDRVEVHTGDLGGIQPAVDLAAADVDAPWAVRGCRVAACCRGSFEEVLADTGRTDSEALGSLEE